MNVQEQIEQEFAGLSPEERQARIDKIFHSFVLTESLGKIFISLVHARQHIEDPVIGSIFAGPLSYLTLLLRQRQFAGDFTELDLRNDVKRELNATGAPTIVFEFMDKAITDFMRFGASHAPQ